MVTLADFSHTNSVKEKNRKYKKLKISAQYDAKSERMGIEIRIRLELEIGHLESNI